VFARAAEIVASGAYGQPLATTLRDDQYFPIQGLYGSTWRKDVAAAGGGTLIEHSIHDVDVLRWMLGDPESVAARVSTRFGHAGIDDIVAATLAYADGSVAQLTSVWHQVLSRESSRRLEVFLDDALIWTEDDYLGPLHVQTSAGTETLEFPLPEWADRLQVAEVYAKGLAAYATPTKSFLDALATSGAAAIGHPNAATALAAHRLVDRAYASAAAGGAPEMVARADDG
jgi:predicted dehydrogenase